MLVNRILFFGELWPKVVHGISISNSINVSMLKERASVDIVEEISTLRTHKVVSFHKVVIFWKCLIKFWIQSLFGKYDFFYGVIYLSTVGIIKNLLTVLFFKLANPSAHVILHFHRSDVQVFLSKRINRIFFKGLQFFTNRFIVLSDRQKKIFAPALQERIYTLNNTIKTEIASNDVTKSFNFNDTSINILYIGNFILEKGIFELISAVKEYNLNHYPFFVLHMFGSHTSDEIKDRIIEMIDGDERIRVNDTISNDEMKMKVICRSDLMVLPSYNEGLPLTLLEALNAGKPIIISRVGFIDEVLGDDYPLYCIPQSVYSLTENFEKYLCLRNDIEFRNHIRSKYLPFSQDAHKKSLLKIFELE